MLNYSALKSHRIVCESLEQTFLLLQILIMQLHAV